MSIIQWLVPQSASASQLIANSLNANSDIFVAYVFLSVILKRSSYLMAFFMSCMLFEWSLFDVVSEYNLYLLTFIIYTYLFNKCPTYKSKIGCAIILFLCLIFAVDATLHGVNGYYGESETAIYNNIEYLSLLAHILFIGSLVDFRRVENSLRGIIASVLHLSRNSAYFVLC